MRPRIKLTKATLISIQPDLEEKIDQVLYATFAEDNENGKEGEALYTTKVMEINGLEYRTFGADFYILDAEPKEFEVNVFEFNLMHECMYSPDELLELRDMFPSNNESLGNTMDKTYLKDVCIVSVYDYKKFEKTFIGEFLSGVVTDDETFRFRPFEQIVTSKIVSKTTIEGKLEVITHSGSCYVIGAKHKCFVYSLVEFKAMRAGSYSPERIVEIREN